MNIKTIDLYEYFGMPKKQGVKGFLKCLIKDKSEVYDQKYIYPAMLVLPGGGYAFCSPREADPIAIRYCMYGFQTFILDYTQGSVQNYPTQFLEAAMAMIYIRENADLYSIGTNMVCAVGFSAGGHLCGCLATLFDDPVAQKIFQKRAELIRPDAVILSYPVITSGEKAHKGSFDLLCGNDKNLREYLSLEKRVTKNSSPAFLWHTYEDRFVPYYNSLVYALACEKNNVPFELHIFEKGRHGLATVERDTNAEDVLKATSTSAYKWLELSVEWLKDRNIKLTTKN
ncbi:MAG TPA: alpha/beta hydrolase [Clostridia bacterium]